MANAWHVPLAKKHFPVWVSPTYQCGKPPLKIQFPSAGNPHYRARWGNPHYYLYLGVGDTISDAAALA
jgi:hypothetical protein